MSVYSETQEIIKYFKLVQAVSKGASYDPVALVQALYNPVYYPVFESMMISMGEGKELAEFTAAVVSRVVAVLADNLNSDVTIGYDAEGKEYDPTIRFYINEDQLLGFADLSARKFYYIEDGEVREARRRISRLEKKESQAEKEKESVLLDMDYTQMTGFRKAVAYTRRKKNAKKALRVARDYEQRLDKIHARMLEAKINLEACQKKSAARNYLIKEIASLLSQFSIEAEAVEPKTDKNEPAKNSKENKEV